MVSRAASAVCKMLSKLWTLYQLEVTFNLIADLTIGEILVVCQVKIRQGNHI